jgi:hypothetical protein
MKNNNVNPKYPFVDLNKNSQNTHEVYVDDDADLKKEHNTPLFIFLIGLGFNLSIHILVVIGMRAINVIITDTEHPDAESRKWASLCKIVSVILLIIISKPLGVLADIYGRRVILLFALTCWFLRLLVAFIAFYLRNITIMVTSALLNGIGLSCLWLPKVILNDILPQEKVSIWYTYAFVASHVCQAIISMGVGLLTNEDFGNVDLVYIAACPAVIAFIVLIFAFLFLIESKPESVDTNYSWKDFIFIFDAKIVMKLDNIGILFIVLFTTFWSNNIYTFDFDNFMNLHFNWSILQTCILTTVGAVVTLILHPWGLTVDRFSDTFVVKGAMACKIIANISFAVSPLIGEYVVYISQTFMAAGGVAEAILKSILASQGNTSQLFGALQTLRSISGLLTTIFLLLYRNELQGSFQDSIKPGLHYIIAAIFIFIGILIFWLYPQKQKTNIAGSEKENSASILRSEDCTKEY